MPSPACRSPTASPSRRPGSAYRTGSSRRRRPAPDGVGAGRAPGLGDEAHFDLVVRVGGAVVPALFRPRGVLLPLASRHTTIESLELAAVGAEEGVGAAVAEQEVEAGATPE